MTPPRQVLVRFAEQTPHWLAQEVPPQLTPDTLADLLSSRVVYYPGSATDGHALKLFGGTHSAHCFIHCDYKMDLDEVAKQLCPEHSHDLKGCPNPRGYRPLRLQKLGAEEVQQVLCILPLQHCGLEAISGWPGSELAGGIWAVLHRLAGYDDAHGPLRLAFLHVRVEAMWGYCQIWARRAIAPYAVVLQDHCVGGGWLNFGGVGSPLFQMAQRAGLPKWLLVARNTKPWPGYQPTSNPEPGGEHGHPRCLYRVLDAPRPDQ
jgi:hypothetical protein